MKYQNRYLFSQIVKDLQRKMVFVGGPRQVGKTTLAKHLLAPRQNGYLNWDIATHREAILKQELPYETLWIFDEIHKYKQWRNYIKGLYDHYKDQRQILVTGSAHLDYYRRGGDSLQGRYYYLRLHPLSVAELEITTAANFDELMLLGGFPEPFFLQSEIEAKRWSRDYRQRLIQEDLISIENVRDLGNLELLMIRLPKLVGSPLSINSLREDLQVAHATVKNWLDIFVRLYAIFFVAPLAGSTVRAVKKEQKHYHYDWTLLEDKGSRFENMIACHLLKWVHYQQDTKARNLSLNYFRDVDGREVDFVITEDDEPIYAIECKLKNTDISKSLKYFKARFNKCQAWQLSTSNEKDYLSKDDIRVCHALKFLKDLA